MAVGRLRLVLVLVLSVSMLMAFGAAVRAQDAPHDHAQMTMPDTGGWELMQDGVLFAAFNHQGGPRGGSEFIVPNWWMGMASRDTSRGRLTFTGMLSLDPATLGNDGYREIFQAGEALDGRPLVDRQHPHDFFMQLAAVWRMPLGASTGFTLAGGPVGEPALGPVAFMHRASAADNPTAPLGHHTLDSTHVAFGVVTAAVDHGPIVVEASLFNGREPDEHRWDFDFGPLDSFSGRIWYRPNAAWELQASSARLEDPEELEPGRIIRSTASASWMRDSGAAMSAVTAAFGRNDTAHGNRQSFLAEWARQTSRHGLYSRFEAVQLETAETTEPVLAFTVGAVRNVLAWRGIQGGFGADVTLYGVPRALQPDYSPHPVSAHVFFRLRPAAGAMGRMWNMRMSQPPGGHRMGMPMNHPMP